MNVIEEKEGKMKKQKFKKNENQCAPNPIIHSWHSRLFNTCLKKNYRKTKPENTNIPSSFIKVSKKIHICAVLEFESGVGIST